MKNVNKLFNWILIALLVISFVVLVWGFIVGFDSNNGAATDVLLNYAYVMVILALLAIVLTSIVIGAINDPKSLVKSGIVILAILVFIGVVYLIAPGSPAIGLVNVEQPAKGMLKLTDTILYMAYILAAGALVAIVIGEIRMSITNRKK